MRADYINPFTPLCVPFETGWGPLLLEVGLVEVGKPAAVPGGN